MSIASIPEHATLSAYAFLPAGAIVSFAGREADVPKGWLICNGSVVSRQTYARLFSAVGTRYGVGDNSTTFQIPDLTTEQEILWAASTTTLPSNATVGGSVNHTHTYTSSVTFSIDASGGHNHNVNNMNIGTGGHGNPHYHNGSYNVNSGTSTSNHNKGTGAAAASIATHSHDYGANIGDGYGLHNHNLNAANAYGSVGNHEGLHTVSATNVSVSASATNNLNSAYYAIPIIKT